MLPVPEEEAPEYVISRCPALIIRVRGLATANEPRSFPSLLPPRRDCPALLHPAHRLDLCLLGSHYPEPDCARCHVLVLLPERAWNSHLVEGVDHPSSDRSVHHRSRYVCALGGIWLFPFFFFYGVRPMLIDTPCRLCLLRFLDLLHLDLLPVAAQCRSVLR